MDNFRSAVAQANGKYLVPLPHDNRFIDKGFFAESVKIMSIILTVICVTAMRYSKTAKDRRSVYLTAINFRDGWSLMEGKDFIRLYRHGGMDFSQAMVLDHEMAFSLKAYDEPFVVNGDCRAGWGSPRMTFSHTSFF